MGSVIRLLAILWASPNTALGLTVGMVGLLTGGRMRVRPPVIEFYGGAVKWLLTGMTKWPFAIALTLGHTVLGQTDAALDISHEHELVHVRQYERWGPLFVPAYLLCSAILWIQRKDAYRDNPFEREAYDASNQATTLTTPRVE